MSTKNWYDGVWAKWKCYGPSVSESAWIDNMPQVKPVAPVTV